MEQKSNHSITSQEWEKFLEEYHLTNLHTKFIDRTVTVVLASLGLITALAWDDALKALFTALVGHETVAQKLTYALIVTLIAIVATSVIRRIAKKKEEAMHPH